MRDLFEEITEFVEEGPPPAPATPRAAPKSLDSPFVVEVDTSEKKPFDFSGIVGDDRDAHLPINVRTVRRRLKTGDYMVEGFPTGLTVERKSRNDLMDSVRPGPRRDNFIDRLKRMRDGHTQGIVLVECYPNEVLGRRIQDAFDIAGCVVEESLSAYFLEHSSPPGKTPWDVISYLLDDMAVRATMADDADIGRFRSLSPLIVYRTSLSWGLQFTGVQWHWAFDRDTASQLCYRLLEKFWYHETSTAYRHHNRPVQAAIDAFSEGQVARIWGGEFSPPYPAGTARRLDWVAGWEFASVNVFGGDRGDMTEPMPMPRKKARWRPKVKSKPDPVADPIEELRHFFDESLK